MQYRPNKQNQVTNFLLSAPHDLQNTECAVGGETFRVVCHYLDSVVMPEELRHELEKDPILQKAREYIVKEWPRDLTSNQLSKFYDVQDERSV